MKRPILKRIGVIRRADFAAYLRALAPHLGFQLDSPDFESARDTGHGLHIKRRRLSASLIVRVQPRSGHGKVCAVGYADPLEDGYISLRVITYTYANGSYTVTSTPSLVIQGIGAGDTFDECAEIDIESTEDPEFDYGSFVSEDTDDTIDGWGDVRDAAEAAVADAGSPDAVWTVSWPAEDWEIESEPRSQAIGYSASSLVGNLYPAYDTPAGWNVQAPRLQFENTGNVPLEIEVTFVRTSDLAETVVTTTVPGGTTSDWIDYPTPTAGDSITATITRVGINGF